MTTETGTHGDDVDRTDEWEEMRRRHLRSGDDRPASAARGVHHVALLSRDVERTIGFYQDLLEFPLTELFENRDYQGSTHFFFDIGNGNALAFFDFPGLDLGPYAEVLGGLHHLAISIDPERWAHLRTKLDRRRHRGARGERLVALLHRTRRRAARADRRSPRRDVRQPRSCDRPPRPLTKHARGQAPGVLVSAASPAGDEDGSGCGR